jgi:glucose/arabinose dehydrogenase
MKRARLAIVLLAAAACRGEASPPPQPPAQSALQHHEISATNLPKPFATESAGNPPRVFDPPPNWTPVVPPGFHISVFATNFESPRNMILGPGGEVIVADSSAGDIIILDNRHNGQRRTFAQGLDYPFGLALRGNMLYVGDENAVVRIPYPTGGNPVRVMSLPGSGHNTRNVIFNRDGSKMYIAVGSASNVSREDPPRAAVTEANPDGSGARTFAWGLRNPVGLAWNPQTGALWTTVNERDGLGEDLVPDYITDLRDGAFYGWPYAYIGQHEDPRRAGERRDLVAKAIVPSLLIQSHSAPLGITFYNGAMFPAEYRGSAFVALHGSWNRAKRTGYKVIRVAFRDGKPIGGYDDFAIGWMTDENGRGVYGRPVGLCVMNDGSLLISDDGTGVIWRVTYGK